MTTNFFSYGNVDLQFAYWMKRKRDYKHGGPNQLPLSCIDEQLDKLRLLRNPNLSCFILDDRWSVGWRDVCYSIWPDATSSELDAVDKLSVQHGLKAFSMVRPRLPLRLKTDTEISQEQQDQSFKTRRDAARRRVFNVKQAEQEYSDRVTGLNWKRLRYPNVADSVLQEES